jgi:hypothetical protein
MRARGKVKRKARWERQEGGREMKETNGRSCIEKEVFK